MTWQRALVLGGGGYVGVAWEAGLCAGLFERGVDLRECDAFVGTSAGAITCARLASGQWPLSEMPAETAGSSIDPNKLDLGALGLIFERWSKMERANTADARIIGAAARDLYRDTIATWLGSIAALVGVSEWPAKPFFVTAVDVASGERKVFEASSGVPIAQAIAASAAVPGIFASVDIAGKRYMDGQVWSSTHADLLLQQPAEQRPGEVVIAMPANRHTSPLVGPLAEREAAAEVEALKSAGCRVHLITPTAEQLPRLGNNLMDAERIPEAFAVGVETGLALAVHLL